MSDITHIKGDLLERPLGIEVIVHQANVNGCMGAGIAGQIRKKFPEMAEADKHYKVPLGDQRLGQYSKARVVRRNGEFLGVNLYGQSISHLSSAGCMTDYNAVYKAFYTLTLSLWKSDCLVGVPKYMGCGLGGGNWGIYESIIRETIATKHQVICVAYE